MNFNSEVFKHIELFVGSIGVILSLFFGLFLLITRKQQPRANLFLSIYLLAFSLRIGKSLFFNYFHIDPVIRNIFLGVLLAIGPSLWLHTHLLKTGKNRLANRRYLWHYFPMVLFISFCWLIPNNRSMISGLFYNGLLAHIAIYSVYALIWLFRKDTDEPSQSQKKIDQWLYFFIVTTLVVLVVYYLISSGTLPYYLGMAFLFSVVVISFAVWALKNPFLFKHQGQKYASSGLSKKESKTYMQQLKQIMGEEKLYLDSDLTLAKLSEKMGITSKQLSQVINQEEQINYSKYITKLRVFEAQQRLKSEAYKQYKISAIAYDSGFNSISSFNNTFKKITGMTAIEYRNADR